MHVLESFKTLFWTASALLSQVAAGKSSLLLALLGEMQGGHSNVPSGGRRSNGRTLYLYSFQFVKYVSDRSSVESRW